MIRAVDVHAFREAYRRLARRRFFRRTAQRFEHYPAYMDAIERAFDKYALSLTLAFRPGHVASQIALAYCLCLPDGTLTQPEAGTIEELEQGWVNARKPEQTQNFLGFWQEARKRLVTDDPLLLEAIEDIIEHESGIDAHDRELIYFSVGLFFRLLYHTREDLGQEIDRLIDETGPATS